MNTKSKSGTQDNADKGRRSFLWKAGVGMSAVLAAAAPAMAKPVFGNDNKLKSSADQLSKQVAALENEKSIRALHKAYEEMLDNGKYGDVSDMFTADAEVIFNGGVFKGMAGLKRLFCGNFRAGQTGKRIEQAPGFELKPEEQQDMVEIMPDKKSAKAIFSYSMQVGAPIDSDSVLVKMARLQGEGVNKWWEGGVCTVSYIMDNNKNWKMKKLEYRTLSRADYRPGRSTAGPISKQLFAKVYPADPSGPDRLVA